MNPFCGLYRPQTTDQSWPRACFPHAGLGPVGSNGTSDAVILQGHGAGSVLWNENRSVFIVCNGELYPTSQESGGAAHPLGSAERLLHLYETHGVEFFSHFEGAYAFVLWDSRHRRLLAGRDRFGMKPLFYTIPDATGRFAFATELSVLLTWPGVNKKLDPVAVDQFLTLSYICHPRTIYQGIKKMSPGERLIAEGSAVRFDRYWSLPRELEPLGMEEGEAVLDQAISRAVLARLPSSETPLCAFLSGGLDSSSVVYHAQHQSGRQAQTFSARFRETEFDEGPMAKITADHLGTRHHEVWVGPEDVRLVPVLGAQFGEPFADPSAIPTYLVSRKIGGISPLALSGDGGDEVLGGYEVYSAAQFAAFARWIPSLIRQGALSLLQRMPVSLAQAQWDTKLRRFLSGAHLSPLDQHTSWRSYLGPELKDQIYSRDFKSALGDRWKQSVFRDWGNLFEDRSADWLRPFQYLDLQTYLVDNNMTKVERMAAANGVEVRMPFLDVGVFTTAFRLPARGRVHGMKRKVLSKKLMAPRLPETIMKGRKKGFAVPLASWFLSSLAGFVEEQVRPERVATIGLLDPQVGKRWLAEHRGGRVNRSRLLWNLICFMAWYELSPREGL